MVWGPVVWIPGIPENEMDCYLGAPRFESQTTNPNHLVDHCVILIITCSQLSHWGKREGVSFGESLLSQVFFWSKLQSTTFFCVPKSRKQHFAPPPRKKWLTIFTICIVFFRANKQTISWQKKRIDFWPMSFLFHILALQNSLNKYNVTHIQFSKVSPPQKKQFSFALCLFMHFLHFTRLHPPSPPLLQKNISPLSVATTTSMLARATNLPVERPRHVPPRDGRIPSDQTLKLSKGHHGTSDLNRSRSRCWLRPMPKQNHPKNPWDVMGCQVATCFEARFGLSRLEGLVFP